MKTNSARTNGQTVLTPSRDDGAMRRARWKSLIPLVLSLVALVWVTGGIGQSRPPAFGLVGLWPGYLRGDAISVATTGRYTYVGLTVPGPGGCARGWRGRLEVIDVSDPVRPVWVSGYNFREPVQRVQPGSNVVYVASGRNLIILTVTNAANPTVLGKCETDDDIRCFQLRGQYLYAVRSANLDVFNISNPAQPVRVGTSTDSFEGGSGVQLDSDRAYVAAATGLHVFDISAPTRPSLLTTCQDSSTNALAVDIAGGYAYLATSQGLTVLSVTNPSQPTLVSAKPLAAGGKCVRALGQYCYLAVDHRLEVLDITRPAQPASVGSYDTGGSTSDLTLAGSCAFVAAGAEGLQILNLTDPAKPTLLAIGTRETGGPAEALQVVGRYAYLADGNSGLQVIDLANTNGLVRVGQFRTANYARTVFVEGAKAYVGTEAGLEIVDVSDPVRPARIGNLDSSSGRVRHIQVVGNVAFLAADLLQIVDVSNPAQPNCITNLDGVYGVRAVQVIGRFAYVAAGWQLIVMNIENPAQPKVLGSCGTVALAQDVQVIGDRAYVIASLALETESSGVAHPQSWLQIFDVSDPTQPKPLGQCQVSEDGHALEVVGHYAYVAGGSWSEDAPGWRDGFMVVNVSDPYHPTRVGGMSTPGWAGGLQVVGGQVYLADGPAGLIIVSLPATGLSIGEEPQSNTVFYGNPGIVAVGAYCLEPIQYQWYQGQSGDTSYPVAGATNTSYSIPVMTQSATYWVRVSSGTNVCDSSSATLIVVPVAVWGGTNNGLAIGPPGLSNVVGIAAGGSHSLALTAEGQVLAWGDNSNGETTVPKGLTNVVAIAAGWNHSLVLRATGQVVAWGYNGSGQTTVPSGLSNVVAIAAGGHHCLALTATGQVVAWGDNSFGETTVPSGLSTVVGIAAGGIHSLALTAEGRVVAWGYNGSGQTTVPSGLGNVVAIAAGGQHSLALTAEGRVAAWGWNDFGQTNAPRGLSNVVAIAAGEYHSLALTAEGQVVAWGYNESGQTTVPSGLSNVVAIAAGGRYSLALIGLPSSWFGPRFLAATVDQSFHHRIIAGSDATAYGATGLPPGLSLDPHTGLITGRPTQAGTYSVVLSATHRTGISEWMVKLFVNEPPAPLISGGLAEAVLGLNFNYAVVAYYMPAWYGASGLPDGLVMDAHTGIISGVPTEAGEFVVSLVASNRYGLGTGTLMLRVSPVAAWGDNSNGQTTMPCGLSNVVTIAAGGDHSLALTAEGQVLAWGKKGSSPTTVPNGLSNVVAIAAGSSHSLALTAAGRVVAWGLNEFGQATVPGGLSNVVAIAAGGDHSLALTAEGQVLAWGDNSYGQTTVPGRLTNVVAIAAGVNHNLALTAEGRVAAWGWNYFDETAVPSGLGNVVAIAAGAYHNLALTAEGRVVAWGENSYGKTTVPGGLSNVVAIAAGGNHSLALTAEGQVVAWGDNSCGQTTVPGRLTNVVAIAAGAYHNLALMSLPSDWFGPRFLVATADRTYYHRIMAGSGAMGYGATGLPSGLSLDPHTGLITGRPAQAGTYSVVLSVTRRTGISEWTVTLFVNQPPAPFIPGGLVVAIWGLNFNSPVLAYNGPEWHEASGLPKGLIMDAQTGVISGAPMEFGDFEVSLVASNRYGWGTGSLLVRVSPVVAWGGNWLLQTTVPGGLSNAVAIAAGGGHGLALTAEGRVVAWGYNLYGETTVPSGLSNVVAIAARGSYSLALTAEGQVVAWGWNGYGQTSVPKGLSNVVAITAGGYHSLALTAEGRVAAWIWNDYGQATVPNGLSNVVAIAAGSQHSLALTAEGQVVAWGDNSCGQTSVPGRLTNVVAIATGAYHNLGLMADGQVVAWGYNSHGETTVPNGLSNVVAIAAGGWDSLALTAEGRVVAWGLNEHERGQTPMPNGLSNVVAIAAGGYHSLALLQQPTVPTPRLELSRGMSGLELQAHGAPGISCQLLRASRLPGPWLPAQPVSFTNGVQPLRAPDTSESAQFFRLLPK